MIWLTLVFRSFRRTVW